MRQASDRYIGGVAKSRTSGKEAVDPAQILMAIEVLHTPENAQERIWISETFASGRINGPSPLSPRQKLDALMISSPSSHHQLVANDCFTSQAIITHD